MDIRDQLDSDEVARAILVGSVAVLQFPRALPNADLTTQFESSSTWGAARAFFGLVATRN